VVALLLAWLLARSIIHLPALVNFGFAVLGLGGRCQRWQGGEIVIGQYWEVVLCGRGKGEG